MTNNGASVDMHSIQATISARYAEQVHAWHTKQPLCTSRWIPPEALAFKVNYDVAVSHNRLVFVAVRRNSEGQVLHCHAGSRAGTNPLKGEALAARLAVSAFENLAQERVLFEGDAQVLISQINDSASQPGWVIAEDVVLIRHYLATHPRWSLQWASRRCNYLAHNTAKWCLKEIVFGVIDVSLLPSGMVNRDIGF